MSKVFVLDTDKRPLNPVRPGRARILLTQGKAAVWRRYPFTIILKVAIDHPDLQPLRLKLDPGSKTTGIALVDDATGEVVFAAELTHRGQAIKVALEKRRVVRRSRRKRHTRYRQARFRNRTRKQGWLAPSLASRVANVLTWVHRLMRVCAITAISQEVVRFDLQQMQNPDIQGIEYQQGTLCGYELREYLLEKWNRTCSYCGKQDVPLQIEHIQARVNGGSNRVSNLCLACEACNQAKGKQDIHVFLAKQPDVLNRLLAQTKTPLKDAAAVNSTRRALYERLNVLGLPVECGSGGLTKFNRCSRGLEKTHWLDAACVGRSTPAHLMISEVVPLYISATGSGCRKKCNVDEFGFPCSKPKGAKKVKGLQTGDLVRAVVLTGKKQGSYVGRVLVRASGSFDLRTSHGRVEGISHRFCAPIHRCDGYRYQKGVGHSSLARFL